MNGERNDQFFSVNDGQYYVKRTVEDHFYILTESNEWKCCSALSDEFYDILSGYVEITEEAMDQIISENKAAAGCRAVDGNFTVEDSDCVFRVSK